MSDRLLHHHQPYHTHARAFSNARTHAHIHTPCHTHAYTQMHTHKYTHAQTQVRANTHTNTHAHTHMRARKHTHTRTRFTERVNNAKYDNLNFLHKHCLCKTRQKGRNWMYTSDDNCIVILHVQPVHDFFKITI